MKKYYKAIIRLIKGLDKECYNDIVKIPLIEAENKDEVKNIVQKKYPQFFQNNKIYSRKTNDEYQFFYVLIYELFNFEKNLIKRGQWKCANCGHIFENRYIQKPVRDIYRLGRDKEFCSQECLLDYKSKNDNYAIEETEKDYIKYDNPIFIYKITQKSTGKCYIGKTKNLPFFRWYNHYKHSSSPFGIYLRTTNLTDWVFEILEELQYNTPNSKVLEIESSYIIKFNSIDNGFNEVISNKSAKKN